VLYRAERIKLQQILAHNSMNKLTIFLIIFNEKESVKTIFMLRKLKKGGDSNQNKKILNDKFFLLEKENEIQIEKK
jgi:hypothetical protein